MNYSEHPFELLFSSLRMHNIRRAHEPNPDLGVRVWPPETWALAICGEMGELVKIVKNTARAKVDDPAARHASNPYELAGIAHELAGIVIYCDLMAERCGIDLGAAVAEKFNRTSDNRGRETKLPQPSGKHIFDGYRTPAKCEPKAEGGADEG